MNSVEIQDKKSTLKQRCIDIVETCKAEVREMTDEEKQEFDENKEKIKELNEELKSLREKLDEYEKDLPQEEEDDETEDNNNNKNSINRSMENKKEFRLLDAINAVVNNRKFTEEQEAVFAEGAKEMRHAGISVAGQITLPTEQRTVKVTGEGGEHDDVIDTDFQQIIDPLRANSVLAKAGAKFLTNCVNDVQYPILNAGNVAWADEVAEASGFGSTFDSVKLTPKRLTASIAISKQFLAQDSIGAEEAIRRDLGNAIIDRLEATILGSASGSTNQPEGMFYSASSSAMSASISSFTDVCDLEAKVEDNNVNGKLVYVASNKAKAALRSMDKGGKHTQLVYENGEVDGTPLYNTSNVSGKTYIVGDFSYLAVAQWAGMDITVDIYSRAKYGEVVLTINTYWDAKKLVPGAFGYGYIS